MIYLRLYWEFLKVGLFAIGGGLATLPFLQDLSQKTGWFTAHQLADMLAVSECTPGPIGINMATYAGYHTAGVPGAVLATLGIVTPSIVIIFIVAGFLRKFRDSRYVQAVFYGIRPASGGLIGAACISVAVIALLNIEVIGVSDVAGLLAVLTGSRAAGKAAAGPGGLAAASVIRWNAVILAAVLLILMDAGKLKRFENCKILKWLSNVHPVFFLAVSAVIGIIFGF